MYLNSFLNKLIPILKKDNNRRYFNYCHRVEKHLLYEIKKKNLCSKSRKSKTDKFMLSMTITYQKNINT